MVESPEKAFRHLAREEAMYHLECNCRDGQNPFYHQPRTIGIQCDCHIRLSVKDVGQRAIGDMEIGSVDLNFPTLKKLRGPPEEEGHSLSGTP